MAHWSLCVQTSWVVSPCTREKRLPKSPLHKDAKQPAIMQTADTCGRVESWYDVMQSVHVCVDQRYSSGYHMKAFASLTLSGHLFLQRWDLSGSGLGAPVCPVCPAWGLISWPEAPSIKTRRWSSAMSQTGWRTAAADKSWTQMGAVGLRLL